MQLPIHPLIERFADFILVNNDSERKVFPNLKQHQRIIVVIGAVNLELVHQFLRKRNITTKHYDAVFQGRFHPQKGVIELIEIWKMVVDQRPKARLVMIGNGPLMENVKAKIKEVKLESNIKLLGYVYDGDKKFKAFSESQIVVHPAFYDSGGMAAAEAMAFGLPCIGFNLEAYKSYYPQGMAKVKKGDLKQFCDKILELLTNKTEYNRLSHAARQMVEKNWSWEKRSQEILSQLNP